MFIMDTCMKPCIAEPRKEVGPYAPKIIQIQIDPQKIGDVVGQRGKTINTIIEQTGVKIDIDDDGAVSVCGTDQASMDKAVEIIKIIVTDFEEGMVLTAHLQLSRRYGTLYACVRGTDELVWFSVNPDSGRLDLRGRCPSAGRFPRHFLLDEETGTLLVANQLSGDVCVFRLDAKGNVEPTPVQRIDAPSAAAVMKL